MDNAIAGGFRGREREIAQVIDEATIAAVDEAGDEFGVPARQPGQEVVIGQSEHAHADDVFEPEGAVEALLQLKHKALPAGGGAHSATRRGPMAVVFRRTTVRSRIAIARVLRRTA